MSRTSFPDDKSVTQIMMYFMLGCIYLKKKKEKRGGRLVDASNNTKVPECSGQWANDQLHEARFKL